MLIDELDIEIVFVDKLSYQKITVIFSLYYFKENLTFTMKKQKKTKTC